MIYNLWILNNTARPANTKRKRGLKTPAMNALMFASGIIPANQKNGRRCNMGGTYGWTRVA